MDIKRIIKITYDICEIERILEVIREDRKIFPMNLGIYFKNISDFDKIPRISDATTNLISRALITDYEEQIERLEKELKKIVNA